MKALKLDMECAKRGSEIAQKTDHNTLTAALSVLDEQGVYAFFLYIDQIDQKEKQKERRLVALCKEFLHKQLPGGLNSGQKNSDVFKALQNLAGELDKLLFARDLLRQALLYGRYHAKARASSGGGG